MLGNAGTPDDIDFLKALSGESPLVAEHASWAVERILRRHGIEDLNPAQGRIVYALWKESPLSQTQLAERTRWLAEWNTTAALARRTTMRRTRNGTEIGRAHV